MKSDEAKARFRGNLVAPGAWYAVILAIGLVGTGVELDRQGRGDPAVAAIVPDAFLGESLESLAKSAFDRNAEGDGEALARRFVERRPIPAEGLSLYANGLLAQGQSQTAASVLQVAAGRGWRDRFVQHVVIASALQNGDAEVSAQRVIGLWKQGERADWLKALTYATLMQPGGLAAFKTRLVDRADNFTTDLLMWAAEVLPAAAIDQLADDISRQKTKFDCIKFSSGAASLVRRGKAHAAIAVWNALCSDGHPADVNDLTFKSFEDEPGPFDWRYPESPGVETQLEPNREGAILHYSNSEPVHHVITSRYLALSAGRYVLASVEGGNTSVARWQIACIAGRATHELALKNTFDGHLSFFIPVGCAVQELSLIGQLGSGEVGGMRLTKVGEG